MRWSATGSPGHVEGVSMRTENFDCAKEAFAFIGDLERLNTVDEVIESLERSLALFGFDKFILTGLPHPQQRLEQMAVLGKPPTDWLKLYMANDYVRVDPVVRMCRRTVHPFEWSEAPYNSEIEPRAAEVMNRAADFRMARGFCLPIHGATGYEACVSMSGTHLDLSARTRPAIHLMALYAFERVRQILGPDTFKPDDPLTSREKEVLMWSATGKSASEVGEILSITKRTVDEHSVRAARKLRAQNKMHAVVKALQHRLIEI
jgi:LuxR family transcriptional regulator, quorum-sensing system regulator BjaR1